jgi:hypothetical protein
MPRSKYFRHQARGEVFLLTSPFIGLGDKNSSYSLDPSSEDLNGVGHLSGFATRQSGVLGIRGPDFLEETLGIRAAAIRARVSKNPASRCPPGKRK